MFSKCPPSHSIRLGQMFDEVAHELPEKGLKGLSAKVALGFEAEAMLAILEACHGNVTAAAEQAKMSLSNFRRLMNILGIDARVFGEGFHRKGARKCSPF